MRTAKALILKSRMFVLGGTASGVVGGIGSLHNVCHSLCVTAVSILAIFGITTQILPLMFLQVYQMYFWTAALVFTLLSAYFYLRQRHPMTRDRNLLLINTGLLIFGLPFSQIADYMDFFRFIGGSLTLAGLFLLVLGKKFKTVYRPGLQSANLGRVQTAIDYPTFRLPKLTAQSLLFIIVIGGFLTNQYLMYRMRIMNNINSAAVSTTTSAMKPLSKIKLTPFDIALAKERMDQNNDGICDTCGMPIQQCIDTGQIDCNMGNNKEAIGILDSQHIHANIKVYVNGNALDFAKSEYYMKSSFIHVEDNQNKENASSVLHMHAKNVPLWLFFRSLGMKLEKDSLTLVGRQVFTTENGNSLKFYLDGKKVDGLRDYVFQPLDKLLISYGPKDDPNLQTQINSVTNYAKDHQK